MIVRLRTINLWLRRIGFVLVVRFDELDLQGTTTFWLTTARNYDAGGRILRGK